MNEIPFRLCPDCGEPLEMEEPNPTDKLCGASFTAYCPFCVLQLPIYSHPDTQEELYINKRFSKNAMFN